MSDVRDDADRVLKITAELRDLRERLAKLDSERTALELFPLDRNAFWLGAGPTFVSSNAAGSKTTWNVVCSEKAGKDPCPSEYDRQN